MHKTLKYECVHCTHTKLTGISRPLMPCLENICTASFTDVKLKNVYPITSNVRCLLQMTILLH